MPDKTNKLNSPKDPQPAIHTQAELEAAQAQVAQLERDLAKTNDINSTYHECEALLQVIRGAITTFQQTNQSLPAPSPATNAPVATNAAAAAQITPSASTPSTTNDADTLKPLQTNAPPGGITNFVAPSATPTPAATSTNVPPQMPAPGTALDPDGRVEDHEHATFPLIGGPPGAQTELLQTSAEQVRRAFELNTQSQLSLYERMLDLLGDQNRKLGELDRKTSELGNQIKSLKNP